MSEDESFFFEEDIDLYLNVVKELKQEGIFNNKPTTEQKNFISEVESRFVVLQGPPGTGKTLTLAHALLAKNFSLLKQKKISRSLLVAPSNNAVDATMQKVSEYFELLKNSEESQVLENLNLIRVTSQDPDRIQVPENVEVVNYRLHEDRLNEISTIMEGQLRLTEEGYLWFATPTGIYKIIDEIFESPTSSVFDLFSLDEASMMTVPKFLKSIAAIRNDAQILISGDHRQMPPVQKHDWDYEDRRTIEEIVPYLSTMDFLRLISEEDDFGEDEFEDLSLSGTKEIPIVRLSKTHRCHKTLTKILKKLIYHRDNISLTSDIEKTLQVHPYGTEGIRIILDPSAPVILIVHEENGSQQANKFEEFLVREIVEGIDTSSEKIGVVTPHNAQRGRMENNYSDCENTTVNTVEKFQGEERDAIIFATTESDPDYIRRASDFILSPHRLTVSLSRMKKKLIIIASKSLINFIPSDAEQYKDARLWKQLLKEMKQLGGDRPDWTGDIDELLGYEVDDVPSSKNVDIYTVKE